MNQNEIIIAALVAQISALEIAHAAEVARLKTEGDAALARAKRAAKRATRDLSDKAERRFDWWMASERIISKLAVHAGYTDKADYLAAAGINDDDDFAV